MKEEQVHLLSKSFLLKKGYSYKGVCNENTTRENKYNGEDEPVGGDVPVPVISDIAIVKIDHQGEKDGDRLWIEDKGSCNTSTILEGFNRVCFAVWYGGGDGLLSVPSDRIQLVNDIEDFLIRNAQVTNGKGRVGILDAETGEHWFY